ncbi:uncharacterized protein LOC129225211 [Uloborus diversus]|uniref:uncharacterized protein LOC129225211 n=1 Tax=Uloborus diversus TaxID=327109 RepID=UPI002409913B|nr:uncharacterized protein LOC129225211 [Uloborus diversus]
MLFICTFIAVLFGTVMATKDEEIQGSAKEMDFFRNGFLVPKSQLFDGREILIPSTTQEDNSNTAARMDDVLRTEIEESFFRSRRAEKSCTISIKVVETFPGTCTTLGKFVPACQNENYIAPNSLECQLTY